MVNCSRRVFRSSFPGATLIGVTAGNIDRVAEFSKVECRDKFAVAADPGAQLAAKYDAANAERPGTTSRTSFVIGKDGKIAYSLTERTPLPHIEMVPTGGVSLETAAAFIRAGAAALGVGGDLVDVAAVRAGRGEEVAQKARRYLEIVREARAK